MRLESRDIALGLFLLGPRYPHGHVYDFVKKLKRNPELLDILGDGTARKSYLHIDDCVRAHDGVRGHTSAQHKENNSTSFTWGWRSLSK